MKSLRRLFWARASSDSASEADLPPLSGGGPSRARLRARASFAGSPRRLTRRLSASLRRYAAARTAMLACSAFHSAGFAEEHNPRFRPTMEDAHLIIDAFCGEKREAFFAVYDGHGGRKAVDYVKQMLHRYFAEALEQQRRAWRNLQPTEQPTLGAQYAPPVDLDNQALLASIKDEKPGGPETPEVSKPDGQEGSPTRLRSNEASKSTDQSSSDMPSDDYATPSSPPTLDAARAFCHAYATMDNLLFDKGCRVTGATSVTCHLREEGGRRILCTANCGDTRAVLARGQLAMRLSHDHKATDLEEKQRVLKDGGFVMSNRVNGVLSVSRALGDHSMKSVIVSTPFVREVVLDPEDSFLILACDGLWDVLSDQEAVQIVSAQFEKSSDAQAASKRLVRTAISLGSTDNITVIVIRLVDRHVIPTSLKV